MQVITDKWFGERMARLLSSCYEMENTQGPRGETSRDQKGCLCRQTSTIGMNTQSEGRRPAFVTGSIIR